MELDYNTARNAIKGDSKAQSKLLSHYDSYINALSIRVKVRDDGTIYRCVDEDMKAEIQAQYLEALQKCRVFK